jgi:hypothetical protein
MNTDIFTKIGTVIVFLFAGMGIATFTMWIINKFIALVLKTFKVWKLFVSFVFDYKQFKQWKNDTNTKSGRNIL